MRQYTKKEIARSLRHCARDKNAFPYCTNECICKGQMFCFSKLLLLAAEKLENMYDKK